MSLAVVVWKWAPNNPLGARYTAEHVNALAAAVARFYPALGRFICVTDDAAGLSAGIEVLPDWRDFAAVPSPHGGLNPSCYRRLRAFHPDIAKHFRERFVWLDIDTLPVAPLEPLWDRPEPVVGLQDALWPNQLNGSMLMMSAGAAPHVWTDFRPTESRALALRAGFKGSDQGWLSYCLPDVPRWTPADGVVSFRKHCAAGLPEGARLVSFHGAVKPWSRLAPQWAKDAYSASNIPGAARRIVRQLTDNSRDARGASNGCSTGNSNDVP